MPLSAFTLCSMAPAGNAEHSVISAMIAVLAVSLLLNITLATVILIQCLRRKKHKVVLHSTDSETYAEPTKQVDVLTAPNKAYELHKITKPSEDTIYEMVK